MDGAHIAFGRIRKVMSRLKISSISYLNTAPLMWDFEHGERGADNNFDIYYTIPSACAQALQVDRTRYFTLDLAEEWVARTGKSFVFAFWAIRTQALPGHDGAAIAEVFKKSRDHGLSPKNLEAIAQEWAPRLGLSVEIVH